MSVTDELLANNARYAESFAGPLPLPPAKHLAVIACMDARLDVYRILGLKEGEAHVIRNAGGEDEQITRELLDLIPVDYAAARAAPQRRTRASTAAGEASA